MNTSHKILDIIEEIKESITDNQYLQLCNLLKTQNQEEQKADYKLYKIIYSDPYITGELHTCETGVDETFTNRLKVEFRLRETICRVRIDPTQLEHQVIDGVLIVPSMTHSFIISHYSLHTTSILHIPDNSSNIVQQHNKELTNSGLVLPDLYQVVVVDIISFTRTRISDYGMDCNC